MIEAATYPKTINSYRLPEEYAENANEKKKALRPLRACPAPKYLILVLGGEKFISKLYLKEA